MPGAVSLALRRARLLVATMPLIAIRGCLVMGVQAEGYLGGKERPALIY